MHYHVGYAYVFMMRALLFFNPSLSEATCEVFLSELDQGEDHAVSHLVS